MHLKTKYVLPLLFGLFYRCLLYLVDLSVVQVFWFLANPLSGYVIHIESRVLKSLLLLSCLFLLLILSVCSCCFLYLGFLLLGAYVFIYEPDTYKYFL